jgi:peptidoglycan/LPS O-acetylase OafA/YrhL
MPVRKERICELDIIKIVAILLVILSHIHFFTSFKVPDIVSEFGALIGVGAFMFVSGYALRMNYVHLGSWGELKHFYKRRVLRIFPPYWVALIIYVLFIAWVTFDSNSFLVYLFGLQELLMWHYQFILAPLWFVGAILIFYTVYSVLAAITRDWRWFLLVSTVVFVLLFLARTVFHIIDIPDPYLYVYYFVFIGGAVAHDTRVYFRIWKLRTLLVVFGSVLILLSLSLYLYAVQLGGHYNLYLDAFSVLYTVLIIDGFILTFVSLWFYGLSLVSLATYGTRSFYSRINRKVAHSVEALAFTCYGVYLLHGIVLESINSLWFRFNMLNELSPIVLFSNYSLRDGLHDGMIIIGAVPLAFLAGYILQSHMDRFVNKIGAWMAHRHGGREAPIDSPTPKKAPEETLGTMTPASAVDKVSSSRNGR